MKGELTRLGEHWMAQRGVKDSWEIANTWELEKICLVKCGDELNQIQRKKLSSSFLCFIYTLNTVVLRGSPGSHFRKVLSSHLPNCDLASLGPLWFLMHCQHWQPLLVVLELGPWNMQFINWGSLNHLNLRLLVAGEQVILILNWE